MRRPNCRIQYNGHGRKRKDIDYHRRPRVRVCHHVTPMVLVVMVVLVLEVPPCDTDGAGGGDGGATM